MEILGSNPCAGNPMFLVAACDELRLQVSHCLCCWATSNNQGCHTKTMAGAAPNCIVRLSMVLVATASPPLSRPFLQAFQSYYSYVVLHPHYDNAVDN